MTDTLIEEETITTDTPPDTHKHYFSKKDLDENLMSGKKITALCGFVKEGLANPSIDLPVCQICDNIWKNVLK